MSRERVSQARLHELLLERGLSPEDLANLVHGLPRLPRGATTTITGRTIRRWLDRRASEHGFTVQRSKICAIARALEVPVEALIEPAARDEVRLAGTQADGRPLVSVQVGGGGPADAELARRIGHAVQRWRFLAVCAAGAAAAYVARVSPATGPAGRIWSLEVVAPAGALVLSDEIAEPDPGPTAASAVPAAGILASQIALAVYLDVRQRASEVAEDSASAWVQAFAGVQEGYKLTPAALDRSRQRLRRAIELNPNLAYALYSLAYVDKTASMLTEGEPSAELLQSALAHAETSIGLDPYDAYGRVIRAYVCSRLGRHRDAIASLERAVALNENLGLAHTGLGHELTLVARYADAIPVLDRAIPLMRRDPLLWLAHGTRALAAFGVRDYECCVRDALGARHEAPSYPGPCGLLAAALHHLGRSEEAAEVARVAQQRWPWFGADYFVEAFGYDDPELSERLLEGVRAALKQV